MKQLRFLFLVIVCFCSLQSAWAADGDVFTAKTVEGVDMHFKVTSEESKTCMVGEGSYYVAIPVETVGNITIPAEANGYKVTSIGDAAFQECSSLTSIVIPNGVISIRRFSFRKCSSLTSIVIPNGVTTIGEDAFFGCSSLTSVVIPESVTSIG